MKAVLLKEWRGYFTTPTGYVFLMMYTLLAGVVFVFVNIMGQQSASMNVLLSGMQLPFLLIAPLLTMRLFAEERRMRTDQLLFTMPVRAGSIVWGKALAAFGMLLFAMALTGLYPLVISRYAQVNAAQVLSVYAGYYLLDVAMLSIGVLMSSLCLNQITAAVVTLGVNVFLYLSEHYIAPQLGSAGQLLLWLPSTARLGDFANGVIGLGDVAYFTCFSALMLFFTCRVMERRRFAKG